MSEIDDLREQLAAVTADRERLGRLLTDERDWLREQIHGSWGHGRTVEQIRADYTRQRENDAAILKAAEQQRDTARAEVDMLRGVGCREAKEGEPESGPCGVCLRCLKEQRDTAQAQVTALTAFASNVQSALSGYVATEADDTLPELVEAIETMGQKLAAMTAERDEARQERDTAWDRGRKAWQEACIAAEQQLAEVRGALEAVAIRRGCSEWDEPFQKCGLCGATNDGNAPLSHAHDCILALPAPDARRTENKA